MATRQDALQIAQRTANEIDSPVYLAHRGDFFIALLMPQHGFETLETIHPQDECIHCHTRYDSSLQEIAGGLCNSCAQLPAPKQYQDQN
jgi:hypothetical protein